MRGSEKINRRVLDVIAESKDPIMARDIERRSGYSRSSVNKALKDLAENGSVERAKKRIHTDSVCGHVTGWVYTLAAPRRGARSKRS
jgi:predicted transcriptional regulator